MNDKLTKNPMEPLLCGARTRQKTACRRLSMANGRCRLHGGLSTGPRTNEGLERVRAAQTSKGMRTAEMKQLRVRLKALRAEAKRLVELI